MRKATILSWHIHSQKVTQHNKISHGILSLSQSLKVHVFNNSSEYEQYTYIRFPLIHPLFLKSSTYRLPLILPKGFLHYLHAMQFSSQLKVPLIFFLFETLSRTWTKWYLADNSQLQRLVSRKPHRTIECLLLCKVATIRLIRLGTIFAKKRKHAVWGRGGGGGSSSPSSFLEKISVYVRLSQNAPRFRQASMRSTCTFSVRFRCAALSSTFDPGRSTFAKFQCAHATHNALPTLPITMITVDYFNIGGTVFCEHAIITNTDTSYCCKSYICHMCVDLISRKIINIGPVYETHMFVFGEGPGGGGGGRPGVQKKWRVFVFRKYR